MESRGRLRRTAFRNVQHQHKQVYGAVSGESEGGADPRRVDIASRMAGLSNCLKTLESLARGAVNRESLSGELA